MADKPWKAFERRVAYYFGGRRRGADTRNAKSGGGKTDIIEVGDLALECKRHKRLGFADILGAARQAEGAAEPEELPFAVVSLNGLHDKNALVVFRLETFLRFFDDEAYARLQAGYNNREAHNDE